MANTKLKKWQKEMVKDLEEYLRHAAKFEDGNPAYRCIPDEVITSSLNFVKTHCMRHNEKKAAKKNS